MKAYAIHRPLGPFTYPSKYNDAITELHNFPHMQWVEEICHNAFGYIEFADGSIPKADLDRYELWTDPREDKTLVMVGRELAKCIKREDWDRMERVWDKAKEKYGYSDDEIERAMSWYEDGGKFADEIS